MDIFTQILLPLITLLAGGGLSWLFFYTAHKRKLAAENVAADNANIQDLVNNYLDNVKKLTARINEQTEEIINLQNLLDDKISANNRLSKAVKELESRIKDLENGINN